MRSGRYATACGIARRCGGAPAVDVASDGDGVRNFGSPALTPRGVEFLGEEWRPGAEAAGSPRVPVLRFVDRTGAGLTRRP
jgi:hypothetical protein